MKKLTIVFCLSLAAITLAGCGQSNQKQHTTSQNNVSANSSSVSTQSRSTSNSAKTLDTSDLTPEENAALVLYYRDAQTGKTNEYLTMMENTQSATVKIYNKDDVPKGEGPADKDYPAGAQLLYVVRLNNSKKDLGTVYYTIVGDKTYYADENKGINDKGVTTTEMVDYVNSHGGTKTVLNTAQRMKVMDLREQNGSTQSSSRNTNNDSLTPQQLGTLVALYDDPDWFKECLDNDTMYYGNQQEMKVGPAGFDYITAFGDSASYVYFKRDGNDVTIKDVVDMNGTMDTKYVTVSRLIKDYYTSQSQKDEVNGYVGQLRSITETQNQEDE